MAKKQTKETKETKVVYLVWLQDVEDNDEDRFIGAYTDKVKAVSEFCNQRSKCSCLQYPRIDEVKLFE